MTRRIALVLAPLALAACAPGDGGAYGESYGRAYPVGAYGAGIGERLYRGDPELDARDGGAVGPDVGRFRSRTEQDAYFEAIAAARRAALRDAELSRQQDRSRRAGRNKGWTGRDLDWAERELQQAEWRDRRPVGSGPYDRADTERRDALFDARRARDVYDRSARLTVWERARLDRLSRADRIQDRIDRLDRMQRRHEARGVPVNTP